MNTRQKKVLRISIIILGVVLLLLAGLFAFRKPMLRKGLDKVADKVKSRTGMTMTIENVDMSGMNLISMENVKVYKDEDTVFLADKMYTRLSIWRAIGGKLNPDEFIMNNARLYYSDFDSDDEDTLTSDTLAVASAEDSTATSLTVEKLLSLNYKEYVDEAFNAVFNYIPKKIMVDSLIVELTKNEDRGRVIIENLKKEGSPYQMEMSLFDDDGLQTFAITGDIDEGDRSVKVNVSLIKGDKEVPLTEKLLNLKASISGMNATFTQKEITEDRTFIHSTLDLKDASMFHPDVSVERIVLDNFTADINMAIGDQYIEMDSTSKVQINNITVPYYFSYGRYGDRSFAVAIPQTEWDAQDFFSSLPDGLFNTFQGIKASGKISYSLLAKVNPRKPETLVFDSSMDSKDLKILSYGKVDYRKINGQFTHETYVRGELDRTFVVSPGSSKYTTLNEVPKFLINSILTAEDGSFWSHNGFNEKAFRESFITNLQDSNFTRGGSTITMQLVKNIYLSKRKTIGRKVEEALIVWLIEDLGLVSKQQMMQTYLNIIEWGPHIYGISEASNFYFGKHPSQLTLAECLFLTSIIPKPRKARYSFDPSTGELKGYHSQYFDLLTGIMLRRGQLTSSDTAGLRASVYLTENAYASLGLPAAKKPVEEEEGGILNRIFSKKKGIATSGF